MKKVISIIFICLFLSSCSSLEPRRVKMIENKIPIPGNTPATLVLMNRNLEIIKINGKWYGDDKRYGVLEVNPVKLAITLRYKLTKRRNTQIIKIDSKSGHVYYIDYVRGGNAGGVIMFKPTTSKSMGYAFNVKYGDITNIKKGSNLTNIARRTYRYLGDCYLAMNKVKKAKHYYKIAKAMGCEKSAIALDEM